MRAAVYLRQSLDRTGDGLAVARQREDAEKLCAARGWTVQRTITENDTSASKGPRPGFAEVMRLVDERAVDVVVVWHVDRLVRRLADLEDVIERCERAGVKLATVTGDIDLSTDAGRLVGRILASVARGEVERKSARQRRARQQAAEAGQPVRFANRAFGYQRDGMTLHSEEADAVRAACASLLAGGTLAGVRRQWTADGFAPPQGAGTWSHQSVKHVLTNPRIAGLSTYRGEIVGPGQWPGIVPEATWRAVNALLHDPSRRIAPGARTLLGALATCVCGQRVQGGMNANRVHTYRCPPGTGCGHLARAAAPVDEFVTGVIVDRLSRPDAVDLLVDHKRPDVDQLRVESAALRTRLDSLALEFADGDLTASQLRTATERIRTRLAEKEAEMADAGRVDVLGPLVRSGQVWAVWGGLTVDRRRAVIGTLATVTVASPGRGVRTFSPSTVHMEWITE